jgi:hypothetical protein
VPNLPNLPNLFPCRQNPRACACARAHVPVLGEGFGRFGKVVHVAISAMVKVPNLPLLQRSA